VALTQWGKSAPMHQFTKVTSVTENKILFLRIQLFGRPPILTLLKSMHVYSQCAIAYYMRANKCMSRASGPAIFLGCVIDFESTSAENVDCRGL